MTLLRDVIDIPEQSHEGDFVLRLTEGLDQAHLADTLGDYVVTTDLRNAFDKALGTVAAAVTSRRSKGVYIHGSFGSGKSHFMAVLHALLGGNPTARGLPDLAEVIAHHDPVLQGRQFLRLAYHLIGAESLEQALFGGYLRQVRELHPDAPLPPLHLTDRLFDDAQKYRTELGDERFFGQLNAGRSGVWGTLAADWTAERFAQAAAASPDDPVRQRLAGALVATMFTGYTEAAAYVDIDTGLRAMAEHAMSLGYEGVVLFLDELVLWLATHLHNHEFISTEGAKVGKLVEAGDARRPIPLVSFMARQRDLKEFIGEAVPGAEQAAISDVFRWWTDRFDQITLGDTNLPYIVHRRLLTPRDENARRLLDEAFERLDRRPEVWNTLLDGFNTGPKHRGADEAAFRRTYPFSPALVSTLTAVASVLQRERTALKVMQQILVDQRNELTTDDVIPVGDVFDYVVTGQNARDPGMERHFASGRRLYRERLQPMLFAEHGLTASDPPSSALVADQRLAKTLLLSALVPEVPALQALDASRLASLNHGTIASPLPNQESSIVLAKVRAWRRQAPEITVGEGSNPTIAVRLADVDYQSVLDKVRTVDTDGARRMLLKQMVWASAGVDYDPSTLPVQPHRMVWRGSHRTLELVFGKVHGLSEDLLVNGGDAWRVIVDYPFDEEGRPRSDAFAKVEGLRAADARTVIWVPRFFSQARLEDLGTLVKLDHLFSGRGERFDENAAHLSVTDRGQVRSTLTNLQATMRQNLADAIRQAYGAQPPNHQDIVSDAGDDRVFESLDPTLQLQEPIGPDLRQALDSVKDQVYSHTYGDHPRFAGAPPRVVELRKVMEYVVKAHEDASGRVPVPPPDRASLSRICNPLQVGEMLENTYVLQVGQNFPWHQRLIREQAAAGESGPATVRQLRGWLDPEGTRGLEPPVAHLVIAAWSVLTDRAWYRHGSPIAPPAVDAITPDLELREQELPSGTAWANAVHRAGELFGVAMPNTQRTASTVSAFAGQVRQKAAEMRPASRELLQALESHEAELGLDPAQPSGRLATAREAVRLLQAVDRAQDGASLVDLLDSVSLPCSDTAMGRSMAHAGALTRAINNVPWIQFDALGSIRDDRAAPAGAILERLRRGGAADEFQAELGPVLREAGQQAAELLARGAERRSAPNSTILEADRVAEVLPRLQEFARQHAGKRIRVTWSVEE
jgi:hypothetical protein